MNTPIRWNSSASGETSSLQVKWRAVKKGLRLMLLSYVAAFVLIGPGVALLWASQHFKPVDLKQRTFLTPEQAEGLGWALVAIGGVATLMALLAGQGYCLRHASTRHGSMEYLFTAVLAGAAAPVFVGLSYLMGVDFRKLLLMEGLPPGGLAEFVQGPGAMVCAAAVMLLLNLLLFSGFLRVMAEQLAPWWVAWIGGLFWVVAFLIGGTLGQFVMRQADVVRWLLIGWALCLVWQAVLVRAGCRWIDRALRTPTSDSGQYRAARAKQAEPYPGVQRVIGRISRD